MQPQDSKGLRLLLAGALLLTPSLASAQKRAASAGKKPAAASSSQPNRGMGEGIKVHGDWTIEVRNPDGTLAVRREFQNALTGSFGGRALAALLSRNESAGRWIVRLEGDTAGVTPSPCGSAPISCQITESGGPLSGSNAFPTLTVTFGIAFDINKVVLSGTATAILDGEVREVSTLLGTCSGTTAPSLCNAFDTLGRFSTSSLGNPVPVVAGQIIQVTVKFSFS